MSDKEVKDILKNRRIELGLTMAQVAKAVGVSEGTVSRWESGDIANMRRDKIISLAKALNLSPRVIMGAEEDDGVSKADLVEERGLQSEIIKAGKLPVIGRVSAGSGVLAYDDILGYEFAEERYCNNNHFFLQVVGDSMSPKIEDGDRVLVHKQDSVDSGNYAVVIIDDEDGCVKIIKYGKGWIELHSINHYYPVRRFEKADTKKIRIIGKVLKVIRTLN